MSFGETVALGATAGFTIFLGLPVGRLRALTPRGRVALAMFAVGVLVFILVDVVGHGFALTEGALGEFKDGKAGFGHPLAYALLLGGGFALGLAGLATIERRVRRSAVPPPPMKGGAADAVSATARIEVDDAARRRALSLGMTIAGAIGLHNFAEGLAIGVSAATGKVTLATVLIIGFALHNATEGFGIVGPVGNARPSWRWLIVAGLIGGAPTFLGTIAGYNLSSEPLELAFYAVSGGAILYVIGEVWNGMRKIGFRELGLWMLSLGFGVGVVTDLVVSYGGG
jgi:ZIP family zinc transporter